MIELNETAIYAAIERVAFELFGEQSPHIRPQDKDGKHEEGEGEEPRKTKHGRESKQEREKEWEKEREKEKRGRTRRRRPSTKSLQSRQYHASALDSTWGGKGGRERVRERDTECERARVGGGEEWSKRERYRVRG